jgi:hypothetical protein
MRNKTVWLTVLVLFLAGCSTPTMDRHVIVGFGIVETPRAGYPYLSKSTVLGIHLSSAPADRVSVGFSTSQTIQAKVPTNTPPSTPGIPETIYVPTATKQTIMLPKPCPANMPGCIVDHGYEPFSFYGTVPGYNGGSPDDDVHRGH